MCIVFRSCRDHKGLQSLLVYMLKTTVAKVLRFIKRCNTHLWGNIRTRQTVS